MEIAFIGIGLIIGGLIGWLIAKQKFGTSSIQKSVFEKLQTDFNEASSKLLAETDKSTRLDGELNKANKSIEKKEEQLRVFTGQLATLETELATAVKNETKAKQDFTRATETLETTKQQKTDADTRLAQATIEKDGLTKELEKLNLKLSKTEEQLEQKTTEFNEANKKVATLSANNSALEEKLDNQKKEIEEIGKKFNSDFEIIANKILEEKTEKFTNTNKSNLEALLKPLGENLDSFKKKVDEVYDKEAKERFSLGEKVKELVGLNEKLSKEASDLTRALKADPKAQGGWGEMILESILEQSGLTKDREYFLENYLKDDNGNYLIGEDGKKMRPDAIIQYPDQRKVIIDSKVSLIAYTNYLAADDADTQSKYIKQHVHDVKKHIVGLSKRGYENFDKSLDFVMMFIPNEPAYMVAVKEEPNLWSFAYEKRIILISPTNLIAALKLISNLWDRDHQSKNAQAIVERGEKLYNKFVGFAENFKKVGDSIGKAQSAYEDATKQLATGNDNLIRQAEKLKALKVNSKKTFPAELMEGNQMDIDPENN
ncbi:DNA recombination protein RmuC [Mangrovibacterium marinum]|uniref:DNA recombination protein RmuC n=1 Tax=Mangrovibacterium marinum TaxID=1639118 RepID=A0A2T5C3I0_9BACT|nr:DNA recombination protein RmuC [Mangrovibacterium marinum]PTN09303.1 DNA recombination protein RmuC [Mangrovibacterium marinum]